MIDVLHPRGHAAGRDERNTGVWLPGPEGNQKVCSIGIACRRWVTWHGLALNVNPDLEAFGAIHPCGFPAAIMTRLVEHEPGITVDDLIEPLAHALVKRLDLSEGDVERVTVTQLMRDLDAPSR